jgi:hypothetical protein
VIKIKEFILTYESYIAFRKRILNNERYFLGEESQSFLTALLGSSRKRVKTIEKGVVYYRARVNPEGVSGPLSLQGAKPIPDLKSEGRANPYNINFLYLANKKEVAIAEARAALYSPVTVFSFRVTKDLRLIDFAHERPSGFSPFRLEKTKEESECQTWLEIGSDFSRPLSTSDTRDGYIPTQILAEFFKSKGYDGVIYQSQFDAKVFGTEKSEIVHENIALFSLDNAEATDAEVWECTYQTIEASKIRK